MDTHSPRTPGHRPEPLSRRRFLGAGAAGVAATAFGGTLLSPLRGGVVHAATRPWTTAGTSGPPPGYGWVANHGLDNAAYQAAFNDLTGKGYRLVKISGYSVAGTEYYASIWTQAPGPGWVGMHGLSRADYQAQFDTLTAQGLRPVDISGYERNGGDAYAALFVASTVPGWTAYHGIAASDYQGIFDQNVGWGQRPLRVSGYTVGGAEMFAAIFVTADGTPWAAYHGIDGPTFQAAFDEQGARGMRLVDISGYERNGTDYYTATFDASPVSFWIAHHNLSADAYQGVFNENGAAGYTPILVAGYGVAGQARYATIWTADRTPTGGTVGRTDVDKIANDALAAAGVPGVSVAIAKDGQLVYAKGYGLADPSTGEAMTVAHRARIASVSKPITATVIVQLAEAGVLTLDDFVFGDAGWLGNDYGTNEYNQSMYDMRIDHLLQHTSGGWGGANDTMFQHTEFGVDELISWTLDNFPPTRAPGDEHEYSNFGYCLLGRIIERATGMSYERYTQQTLLNQCGITRMQIAGDTLAERVDGEVFYDGTNSTIGDPYRIPVRRMDSHGGWIASATDLLRFMVRMDQLANPADVVRSDSLTVMTTPSTAKNGGGYSRGWAVNGGNWFHNGRLGGTESIVVRHDTGISYAVIANGNGINPDQLGRDMAYAVADWGTGTPL